MNCYIISSLSFSFPLSLKKKRINFFIQRIVKQSLSHWKPLFYLRTSLRMATIRSRSRDYYRVKVSVIKNRCFFTVLLVLRGRKTCMLKKPGNIEWEFKLYSSSLHFPREGLIHQTSIFSGYIWDNRDSAHTSQSEQDVARAAGCLGERMCPQCVRMLIIRIVRGCDSTTRIMRAANKCSI